MGAAEMGANANYYFIVTPNGLTASVCAKEESKAAYKVKDQTLVIQVLGISAHDEAD